MEENVLSEQNEEKVVNILPLDKWKRFLVHLADFFINFIFAFLILNIAVAPIGKAITGFNNKTEIYNSNNEYMRDILYGNNILKVETGHARNDMTNNIAYTYDCWLSYYVIDEEESPNIEVTDYGHKSSNEVIYNFYHNIRSDDSSFETLFSHYNNENKYFALDNHNFVLLENVKNALHAYFDPRDEMGELGKTFYDNIQNNVFMPLLSEVFTNIETNDLIYENHSYIESQKLVNQVTDYRDAFLVVVVFISLFLSWGIYYVVIPFINRNRKTLAMIMMRIERINIERLYICKRWEALFSAIYSFITNLMIVLILPVALVSINYVFSFNSFLFLAGLSLLFNIVSLGFILFNSFNRSLSDIFSHSVMITTDNLDAIYRAKGYNI